MKLFCDGSVHPQSKIGYGAYLLVLNATTNLSVLKTAVKTKQFSETSSTKLELETLLWALSQLPPLQESITIYTDSQNILSLLNRRERLEGNNFITKKGKLIANHLLYKEFYQRIDNLNCEIIKLKGHPLEEEKDEIDRIFELVDQAPREALRNYLA
jgi:ribonuclease HI